MPRNPLPLGGGEEGGEGGGGHDGTNGVGERDERRVSKQLCYLLEQIYI